MSDDSSTGTRVEVVAGGHAIGSFTMVPDAALDLGLSTGAAWLYVHLLRWARAVETIYPSQERLAGDVGASVRSVRDWTRELEAAELVHTERASRTSPLVYVVWWPGEARAAESAGRRAADSADEVRGESLPSSETPIAATTKRARNGRRRTPNDDVFDAFVDELGYKPQGGEAGKWSKAIRQLLDAGVDPSEVPGLVRSYRSKWPGVSCSPNAIHAHLGELRAQVTREVMGVTSWRRLTDEEVQHRLEAWRAGVTSFLGESPTPDAVEAKRQELRAEHVLSSS